MSTHLYTWKQRLNAIARAGERVVYVTRDEYRELRTCAEKHYDYHYATTGAIGGLDYWLGVPVVVDDDEAARQGHRLTIHQWEERTLALPNTREFRADEPGMANNYGVTRTYPQNLGVQPAVPRRVVTNRRDVLQRQLSAIADQLAILDSLPKEPDEKYEPALITFKIKFPTCDKVYEYAAIRCVDNGLWYTTGGQLYSWEDLAQWMLVENDVVEGIWLATEFERVGK